MVHEQGTMIGEYRILSMICQFTLQVSSTAQVHGDWGRKPGLTNDRILCSGPLLRPRSVNDKLTCRMHSDRLQ